MVISKKTIIFQEVGGSNIFQEEGNFFQEGGGGPNAYSYDFPGRVRNPVSPLDPRIGTKIS